MKTALSIFSLVIMLEIFINPFTENNILHNAYAVNEFMHWLQVVLLIIVIWATRGTIAKGVIEERPLKSLKDHLKNRKTILRKLIAFVDYLALPFLAFYVWDWSFSIALGLSLLFLHFYDLSAKEAIIFFEEKGLCGNCHQEKCECKK